MTDESTENYELRAFAVEVVKKLAESGHKAFFAGGCVRDQLLGRTPKDFDVATSARPEQIIELFPKTVKVGLAFGVVRVIGRRVGQDRPPLDVEVATFRAEEGYSDGRHPDKVRFTNEEEDVKRRDFTINGLLFDPLREEVKDFVDGEKDLKQGIIRAIGDPRIRFEEDRLRILRAVRFAANLEFKLDQGTWEAIKELAPSIQSVSQERIRDELVKMMTGPAPRRALELMKESGLLGIILPEVEAFEGVEQPPQFHPEGDVWVHTLLLLGQLSGASKTLALGALLHDVGKPATFEFAQGRIRFNEHDRIGAEMSEGILRRLRFSSEEIERVTSLVRHHMVFKDVPDMRAARLKRFLRMPHIEEHLELHRIDCLACHGKLDSHAYCMEQLALLSKEKLRPPPLLDGRHLIELGFEPGPIFGKILTEVEDRQLEGLLSSQEEALAFVRRTFQVNETDPTRGPEG